MQRKVFGIIHFILILTVTAMGLPQYMAGDLNRDREVDLADAVIGAKNLTLTLEKASSFTENVKSAISAIQLAAGLKAKIKAEDGKKAFQNPDQCFLIPATSVLNNSSIIHLVSEEPLLNRTFALPPQTPPPRMC
jgi:hypothetical protein